ncbi:MAG: T9SS type A sorting domain-containing protein, partial [Bacteroidota bacterium]
SSITGLTTNTSYFVRAYATNSVGTAYGDQISFTTLSLPVNSAPVTIAGSVGAGAGYPVSVPVTVTDFNNITGISLRLEYNPNVMTFSNGSNINPSLAGMILADNHVSPDLHKVVIAWTNSIPVTLADNSKLIDLVFTYISGTTTVAFNNTSNGGSDCEYADANGDPLVDIPASLFYINGEVRPGLNITGSFQYNNNANTVLDSVWVILKQNGIKADSVQTNVSGQYAFIGKNSAIYTIGANSTKPWGGVNATDAIKVERHFVGIELLSVPVRWMAGDVNNSNFINATDATKIKRRFVGLESSFARGDWVFAKPTGGDTVILASTNIVQDFQGLCVGDVNGSYIPMPGDWTPRQVKMASPGTIEVSPGQTFELPINAASDMIIGAVSLFIPYPVDLLEAIQVSMEQGSPVFNITNGEIRIAWSEVEPLNLKAEETLLTLRLRAKESFTGDQLIELHPTNDSELADDIGKPLLRAELSTLIIKPLKPNGTDEQIGTVSSFRVYPNPAQDVVFVEATLESQAECGFQMMNGVGREVKTIPVKRFDKGTIRLSINTSDLPNGLYSLKISFDAESGQKQILHKVVINR